MMRRFALLLALATSPAAAHVTVLPPEAPANAFARIAFAVPHGCAGQATTAIEVTIPEGIGVVRPMPKPGWELSTTMRALERPVPTGHGLAREAPGFVAWRGGPLAAAHYDEFVVLIRTPDRPGDVLAFAVAQLCENGARHDWAGEAGARQPAATLRLLEARR